MMQGKYTLEIDDFVKDKHTDAGRRLGKCIKNFVTEGALVIPQNKTFYVKMFHDIYQDRE